MRFAAKISFPNLQRRGGLFLVLGISISVLILTAAPAPAKENFSQYCANAYKKTNQCPSAICRLQCEGLSEGKECPLTCVPKDCPEIPANQCPRRFCSVMKDCSKTKICHYRMAAAPPACGDLAYAGQDVPCCQGLVRRCGVQFLDWTCDMEGKGSIYNLPICIPCGDGLCGQFENRCNCPEDCGPSKKEPFIYEIIRTPKKTKDGQTSYDVQTNSPKPILPKIISK